ncbi:MAG: cupredoxin domain-containing protein [Dehalococcoidia bacterium]|nr:cupredoxin domain-containing protein [Dehalococcoidia bacterium]
MEVDLGEWFIVSGGEEAPSGEVKLVIRNQGRYVHEFEVIRKVAEYQEYEVAEVDDIAPGETATLDLQLSPGTYELACTIVEREADGTVYNHYLLGMSTYIYVPEISRPGASFSQNGAFQHIRLPARVIRDSRMSDLDYPEIPVQDLASLEGTQALLRDAGILP